MPWDVNKSVPCNGNPQVENSTTAAKDVTETLELGIPYYEAGWLKALLFYARSPSGWAMELPGSILTKEGEALDNFADSHAGWLVESSPNVANSHSNNLNGISCTGPTACTAVGTYTSGPFKSYHMFAERWNGSEWSIQTTPNPVKTSKGRLLGVSCTSRTECTAVGSADVNTLAERWNGTVWSVETTPNPVKAVDSHLRAVSCISSTTCTAVGYYHTGETTFLLAQNWNGKEWTIQPTSSPIGSTESFLEGVSCSSLTECTAVGGAKSSSGLYVTLAERWSGKEWLPQTTPNPMEAIDSNLYEVSCASSTICVAVGYSKTASGSEAALVEYWNGKEWKIQITPNIANAVGSHLNSVSCISSTACISDGNYSTSSATLPLVESWDGKEWKVQAVPHLAETSQSQLRGVSCVSQIACTAIGNTLGSQNTFVMSNF